ncbi:3-isopropylmalate dehydrogenase [Corynebacterium pseudokroppenstedtii]|uniref:3-isopropylmalate dehydrogenase n=1 Tax=Corynebacterium pseudokroppenstedtii TaxID=2804917 RepID=A0AAU0PV81_9CORY|nr:3-isopropylmalate dehydrogenase [Corynebacterium pseudokroppenstedtii]MDU7503702.1 3-isopropylmalate dehydrogenase [Corynebacterium kroppenstedtii]MBY0789827.1 3-isopropylmalate dehydrogenase [Corynebacterium pseudokroppenstedtii]MCF6793687.1 3-isopropylmalate dehydrogenase [Corynebacterium pseudokroppenstedtii]MCF8703115.1 3-isopropylmalate dehydrogenase [Corynebacterium pseudokroppenstedtii]MCG2636629.1 3-isopropylmalate dehydrogenase [Corynebacterium pseudokroppenstedtii]
MKLAVIPGDGIGTEVTAEALKVMRAALAGSGESIETTEYDLGARRYLRNGELLTDDDLASLREHDAILLGAVGDPRTVPSGVLERGLLLKMRFALDHHVNLRPSVLYPGVTSPLSDPGKVDFIVVREGTEGLYAGNGGSIRADTPHEVANETSVNTRYGVERVVRYAFDRAQERRKKLTLVHKTNVLVYAGGLWQRTVDQVAQEYPDVEVNYCHIDAATIYMVTDPSRFDVIVTDNLFGDIITDLAGAVTGGIGLAASGNIDATGTNPSMFEPVHGSAPDIAGKGIADPTAAILSGALLFRHLGKTDEADAIEAAVRNDVASRDGSIRTEEVGTRIANSLDS